MDKNIIWIVDDDFIYQTIIKKLIQKSGVFSAHSSFSNGKEAINTLKNTIESDSNYLPNIILLDINMPVMDGWEFMGEIKKIKNKINNYVKIYIVSSSIAIEDKDRSKTYSDINGYIPKPITVQDLLTIVSKNKKN